MPEMKVPGPEHPITVAAAPSRYQVLYNGHVLVDSRDALLLKEATYKPALYFPREDADMAFFARTQRVTHCPYKRDAHYFTLDLDGRIAENAVWTYEDPYPAMEAIRGRIAFYPNQVEIREVEVVDDPAAIRDAILHTDAGAGRSQAERWSSD